MTKYTLYNVYANFYGTTAEWYNIRAKNARRAIQQVIDSHNFQCLSNTKNFNVITIEIEEVKE